MSTSATSLPAAAPTISVRSADHLPSLDGLRAISILLVLVGHMGGTRGFAPVNLGIGDYSHLGVVVFFVISGFLITRLMLKEQEKNGRISLRRFYERRALRLFPAAYTYIAFVGLLTVLGFAHLRTTDIWHAVTYTVNYLPDRGKLIGHLWSLSVEEQFYLLWPLTFVLMGFRRSERAVIATILLGPVARFAAWYFLRGTPYRDLPMFPVVADSIAMGCLLAQMRGRLEALSWYRKLMQPTWSLAILAMVLLINRYMDYTVVLVFGTSLLNLGIAVLIHRCVYHPDDAVGTVLNWKPIATIGVLSYSLYLWQQLFLNHESVHWYNAFPQNILLAIATALASYFLLEMPLLKLRRRLRP